MIDLDNSNYVDEQAVNYLIKQIPSDVWQEIKEIVTEDPNWETDAMFGIGLYIRNKLYEANFTPPMFVHMDNWWVTLVKKVLEKI